jgi:hypothetical protein
MDFFRIEVFGRCGSSLQNGKLSGCRLEALARAPGNQLSPLLDRRSKIIPDGMISVQTVCRLPRGLDLYVWYTLWKLV